MYVSPPLFDVRAMKRVHLSTYVFILCHSCVCLFSFFFWPFFLKTRFQSLGVCFVTILCVRDATFVFFFFNVSIGD